MRYNIGDVLICATDEMYGQKRQHLIIGHKYVVLDVIEMSEDKIILDVKHLSSSKRIGIVSDRHFIPLDVYREFQLRKILN
mgnify:CR=1 FL=1|jgi:hypothetical protein